MTKTLAAKSRQEERTARRLNQILHAARLCVRDQGFHAASVSCIAANAAMSAGHIYKYFQNKEAIMIALIEHDIDEFMLLLTQVDQSETRSVDTVIDEFVRKLPSILDNDRTALWLELQAEAARNSKVEQLAILATHRFHQTIRSIIEPVLPHLSADELDTRAEVLLVMMHGLGVHAVTRSRDDTQVVATAIEFVFRAALSSAHRPETPGGRHVPA